MISKAPSPLQKFWWCVLASEFFCTASAVCLHAQAVWGNVSETVTDLSGAVIAGAQVIA
jgi:hypothetical protein